MLTIIAIIVLMIVAAMFMLMPGVMATLIGDGDPLAVPKSRLRIMRFIGLAVFAGAMLLTMMRDTV